MIFARFMTIYGHKFKSAFQSEDEIRIAKREWALSLQGYSEAELVLAVNRSKESFIWMPTVAEFLSLLRRDYESFGLPSTLEAYREACFAADHPRDRDWSHPAVYHAGRATDWFRLRTEEKSQVFRDFEHYYRTLCQRVVNGESLDLPVPMALPDKSSNTLSEFITRWGEEQGITPEQAATLLFYLSKPKGSPVRAHFRQQAQTRMEHWGLDLQLPDDYRQGS
nr:replication protein P [Motiliproteus sediminis]